MRLIHFAALLLLGAIWGASFLLEFKTTATGSGAVKRFYRWSN